MTTTAPTASTLGCPAGGGGLCSSQHLNLRINPKDELTKAYKVARLGNTKKPEATTGSGFANPLIRPY